MTTRHLEKTRTLLAILKKEELDTLKSYLEAFDTRSKRYTPKTLRMLETILEYENNEQVLGLLPRRLKTTSASAMRMVNRRLNEKILYSLVQETNINRQGAYSDVGRVKMDIQLRAMAVDILIGRRCIEIAMNEARKLIDLGKKYELYDEIISLAYMYQRMSGNIHGLKEYRKVGEEVEQLEMCRRGLLEARMITAERSISAGFKGSLGKGDTEAFLQKTESQITQLNDYLEKTGSPLLNFYYLRLVAEYEGILGNMQQMQKAMVKQLDLMRNNPALDNRLRLVTALLNCGKVAIALGNYDDAENFCEEAAEKSIENSHNYCLAKEYVFMSRFYTADIDGASQIMESLLSINDPDEKEFRIAMRHYWMACVYFAREEFGHCYTALQFTTHFDRDREGWNIANRILTIMTLIEQESYDIADNQIVALRQFMQEGLKGSSLVARDQEILKVLLRLRKHAFHFDELLEKEPAVLNSLFDENTWEKDSPELIPFHDWVLQKARKKKYELKAAAEVEALTKVSG